MPPVVEDPGRSLWGWRRGDRRMGGIAYLTALALSIAGLAIVVNQVFNLGPVRLPAAEQRAIITT